MNYFKIKALSNSTLFSAFSTDTEKAAFLHVGSAVDAACTAPDNFDMLAESYFDEASEEWVKLTPSQFGQVLRMKYEFDGNAVFTDIRDRFSSQAYKIMWFEPSTGTFHNDGAPGRYLFKAKPDFSNERMRRVADLKTTSCDDLDGFIQVIPKYNYDSSVFIYMEMFGAERFAFLCIRKKRSGTFIHVIDRNSDTYKDGKNKLCNINYKLFSEYSFEVISATL